MLRILNLPWLVAGLFLLNLAGCGESTPSDPKEADESFALNQVAEGYRVYTIAKKKPPTNIKELTELETLAGNGVEAVRKGDIVVQWGAPLPDTDEEPGHSPSTDVLAYVKDVPDKGGYVLLLNRSVKKMTAEEFKAAPKAGTAPTTTSAPARR